MVARVEMRGTLFPPHQFDLKLLISQVEVGPMTGRLAMVFAVSAVPSDRSKNRPQVSRRLAIFSIFGRKSSRNTFRTCRMVYGLVT